MTFIVDKISIERNLSVIDSQILGNSIGISETIALDILRIWYSSKISIALN